MKAAFYKGTRPNIQGLYNIIVRAVTKGVYSHCEFGTAARGDAGWI